MTVRKSVSDWLPFAGRVVLVALILGALTQLVLHAAQFSHDRRYLDLLASRAGEGWFLAGGWALLLLFRWHLEPTGTNRLLGRRPVFELVLLGLLLVLASPFGNAYFSHFTHPVWAGALVWTLGPAVSRAWHRMAQVGSLQRADLFLARTEPWLGAVLSCTIIFVQSYRRHLWFGSGGKDLGLFHQTVWLLSRFETPHNTVMGMHAFADHLEFIDLLAAPVQWIWPTAGGLLLFQAVIVGSAAIPIFDLTRRKLDSRLAAWALVVVFLFGFDLQTAVMFDWNPTTCGAGLIPWVVWCFERERPVAFCLTLTLLALCKENLVLYGLGLCLALAVGAKRRRLALAAAAVLAAVFVIEIEVVFPIFRSEGFRHFRYGAMGASGLEMAGSVLVSPYRSFALLFTPGAKIDGLLIPFSTVAFVCLLAPRYLLALAPMILERFWSDHSNRWWGFHYGAGLGVLATVAAVDGLARVRRWGARRGWTTIGPGLVAVVSLSCLLLAGLGRFGPAPLWAARHSYYTTARDRADAEHILSLIPPVAAVAAQNHLLPHLSGRREIHQLVRPDNPASLVENVKYVTEVAEYVVLDFGQSAWPKGNGYARRLADELRRRGFGTIACRGQAVLMRRNQNAEPCPVLDSGSS